MDAKEAAGRRAAEMVTGGMVVGLGTGTTAVHAVRALGERVAAGLKITGVATSDACAALARECAIPLLPLGEAPAIDVTIDGADEVDPHLRLIKGGGGALVREKLVASSSRRMIVVVHESKLVQTLGAFPLPVAIVPFGWQTTLKRLSVLCRSVRLRKENGAPLTTDDGFYIADLGYGEIRNPDAVHAALKGTLGVVETGLFIGLATEVVVGYPNGETRMLTAG